MVLCYLARHSGQRLQREAQSGGALLHPRHAHPHSLTHSLTHSLSLSLSRSLLGSSAQLVL